MSNEKFEKFIELADGHIEKEIKIIDRKDSADALIYTYILENKHKLRRVAARHIIDHRQCEMNKFIRNSLSSANIYSYDSKTIDHALNKIGIITLTKTMYYIGLFYCLLFCSMGSAIFINNGVLERDDAYPILVIINFCALLLGGAGALFSYMFVEDTKFRLFWVKKG